uniref:LOW QUALITY PROTEIN: uncharacterized protein n=1 Tax=Pogona vitticeps TaxID=103695 RepID=A0ABM5F8M9_9SAUR
MEFGGGLKVPLWTLLLMICCIQQKVSSTESISGKINFIPQLRTTPTLTTFNAAHNGRVCSTWGNFHYKTFDGDIFPFPGLCNYVFASHCHTTFEDFNIQIRRVRVDNITPISSITMRLEGVDIEMQEDAILVNSERVQLPYSGSGFTIEKLTIYVKVAAKLGLTMLWNEKDSLMLELDGKYVNQTCGLCGDFNGIPTYNEFFSNNVRITPLQFGNMQKLNGPTEDCNDPLPLPLNNCTDIRDICREVLTGTAFSECNAIVWVDDYIDACVQDLCLCANPESFSCLCDTFAEYSRQCAHAGGHPQNWRTPQLCPMSCPFNMEYQECGSPCEDTCTNAERSQLCEEHCIDGCFCPPGTVYDDISGSGCIPLELCSCIYNGKSYAPGTTYSGHCRTCSCTGGEWQCTDLLCPGICTVEGGSHISTYDEKHYDVHGDCTYVLSKVCNEDEFTVLGELRRCGLTETETCLKMVALDINGGQTSVVIKSNGDVFLNWIYTQLPISAANVTVFRPSTFFIIVETNVGLQLLVQLVPIMQLYLRLDPSFKEKTCGLCGNFNSRQTDDFQAISGVVEGTAPAFANTWKTQAACPNIKHNFEDPCTLSIENEKYAHHWCGLLTDSSGPFAKCHSAVNPAPYHTNCLFDTCNCERSEDCMCAALSSYVIACAAKGVALPGWRTTVCSKYTTSCPKTLTYSYSISSCQPTCRSLSEPDVTCNIKFVPVDGCTCENDTYMDDSGKCVPVDKCPCYYKGTPVHPGEVLHDFGAVCTCTQGKLNCIGGGESKPVCTAPMVYFDCRNATAGSTGAECQKSCQTFDMHCYSTQCVSGCMCPSGLVSDGKGDCIPMEECPCIHNDATYKAGEKIQIDCNTCVCKNRMWKCTKNKCLGTCAVYGDGHYITFDDKRYTFSGKCEYTLVQDHCGKNSSTQGSFRVITENIPCGTTGTTCSKSIKVFVGNYELILSEEHHELIQRGQGGHPPYRIRYMGIYLIIETYNGLIILWDKKTSIFIKLSDDFRGQVCGLCGNYDGNGINDFTTRSQSVVGDVLEFGNSWKVSPTCSDAKCTKDPCTKNPYRKSWSQKQCSIINSKVFASCHSQVDPTRYYEACVADSCACDTGGDCECFCTAVAAYAQACSEYGVCISWRSPSICPLFCDYYNTEGECDWHYKPCGAPCMKTCRNPSGRCLYELPGLEGCYPYCPANKPYFSEDEMKCVDVCGCYDSQGNYHPPGTTFDSRETCQSCQCTSKGMECRYDPEACYCHYEGKTYIYKDVIYNTTDGLGWCIIATCDVNGTISRELYKCAGPSTTTPFTFTTVSATTTSGAESTTPSTTTCVHLICEWTEWYDVTYPKYGPNNGDYETPEKIRARGHNVCKIPDDVECRAQSFPTEKLESLGQKITCTKTNGLICNNKDQNPPICYNYEIRFFCCEFAPCGVQTTVPFTTTTTETTTKSDITKSETTHMPTVGQSTSEQPPTQTIGIQTSATTIPITPLEGSTMTTSHISKTQLPTTTESTPEVPVSTTKSILTPPASSTSGITSTTCQPNCQWTQWFNTYYPSSSSRDGDFETLEDILSEGHKVCENPTDIQCRAADYPEVSLALLGQKLTCNLRDGLQCLNADQTGKYKMCYDYEVRYKCCDYSHCGKETSTPGATTAATTALPGTTPKVETSPGTSKGSTPAPPVPSTTSRTTVVSPTPEVPASPSTAAVTSVKSSTVTPVSLQSTPVSKPTALLPTTESTPEVPVSTTKSILTPPASSTSGITSTTCQPNCQWTQWFDTYYPSSSSRDGDFETLEDILSDGHKVCENPTDIQCRAADYPEVSLALLGQKLTCNLRDGLQCLNADQTGKYKMCYDYEVRYKCCDYSHCGKETSTPGATTAATTALPGTTPKVETSPGTPKGSTPAPPVPSTTSRTTVVSPTPEVPGSVGTPGVTHVESSTVTATSLQSTPITIPTTKYLSTITPEPTSRTSTICQPKCQWTEWFDTYYPSSDLDDGDIETLEQIRSEGGQVCKKPQDIECRAEEYPDVNLTLLGQEIQCNRNDGLRCLNADQPGNLKRCLNYQVRFECCKSSNCSQETSTPGPTTTTTTAAPGTTLEVETTPGTSKGSTSAPTVLSTTSRTTVVSPTPEVPVSPSTAAVTSVKGSTVTPVSLQSTPVSKPTALLPTTEITPEVPVSTTKSILTPPASSTSGIASTTCQPNCQWTQWFDTYYPSSSSRDGDFETLEDILSEGHKVCKNPTDIQCRAEDYPEVSLARLGQKLTCNLRDGLQCLNADQTGKYKMCYNYEVRYKCCDYSHCGKETSTPGATTAASTSLPGTTPKVETPPGTSKGSTPAPPVPSTTSRTTVVSTTPEVPASPSTAAVTSIKGSTVTPVSLQSTPVSKPTALLPTTESTPEVPVSTTKSILTPPASSTSGITSTTCQPNCQWTQWFDTYYPSSSSRDGDFETLEDILSEGHKVCENPTDIQCRAADYPEVSLALLGQNLTCNLRDGLQCLNADQTGKYKMCYDYEVRYKCCDYSHCGQETSTPGATTTATTALPGTTPKVETPPGTSKGSTPAPPVPSTTSRTTVVSPTPEVPASPSTAAVTSVKSSTVTPVSLQSTPVSKPTALLPTTESTPEVPVSTTKSILTPPASSTSGITSTTCQPNCQWTQWFDTYYPSSSSRDGDFESLEDILSEGHKVCENPTDIQCRAADYPEVSLALLGQKLTCNLRDGLQCLNADQTGKYKMCYDYEVRYKCCDYSHCGKETSTPGATTAATTALPGTTPEEETPPGTSKGSTPAPPVPSTTSRTTVVSPTPEVPGSASTPTVTSVEGPTVTAVSLQSTPVSKPTAVISTREETPGVSGGTTVRTTPGTTPGVETPPGTSKGSTPAPPVPSTTSRTTVVSTTPEVPASPSTAAVTSVKGSTVTPVSLQSTPVSKPTALLPTTESTPEVPVSTTKSILTPPASSTSGITSTTCQPNCQWTQWFDTYYPSSSSRDGDFETLEDILSEGHKVCENPTDIQCRAADYPEVSLALLGQKLTCNLRDGLQCLNADQTGKYKMCYDYEVRYKCCDYSHCGKETSTPGATTAATTALPGTTPEEETPPGTSKGSTPAPPVPSTTSRTTVVSPTPEVPGSASTPTVTSVEGPTVTAVSLQSTPVSKPTAVISTREETPGVSGGTTVRTTPGTTPGVETPPGTSKGSTPAPPVPSTTSRTTVVSTTPEVPASPSTAAVTSVKGSTVTPVSLQSTPVSKPTALLPTTESTPEVPVSTTKSILTPPASSTSGITSTTCQPNCQWTQWFDTYYPSSSSRDGDFESLEDILSEGHKVCENPTDIQCRAADYPEVSLALLGQKLKCNLRDGLQCLNADQTGKYKMCYDYEVRYKCCDYSHCGKETSTPGATTAATTALPGSTPKVETPPGTSKGSTPAPPVPSTTSRTTVVSPTPEVPASPSTAAVTSVKSSTVTPVSLQSTPVSKPTALLPTTESTPEVPVSTTKSILTPPASSTSGITSTTCQPNCQWTQWFDTYYPSSSSRDGDFESLEDILSEGHKVCENPTDIQCRAADYPEVSFALLGQKLTCNLRDGLQCLNADQTGKYKMCYDYEVRYKCCDYSHCGKETSTPGATTAATTALPGNTPEEETPPGTSKGSTPAPPVPSTTSRTTVVSPTPEVPGSASTPTVTSVEGPTVTAVSLQSTPVSKPTAVISTREETPGVSGGTTVRTTPGTTPGWKLLQAPPRAPRQLRLCPAPLLAPPWSLPLQRSRLHPAQPQSLPLGSTVTPVSLQSTPVSKPTALLPTTESTPEVPVSTTKSILTPPASSTSGITSTTCQPNCQWTQWFDTYYPSSSSRDGDFETLEDILSEGHKVCENPTDIQCRAADYPEVSLALLGQKLTCNLRDGLQCLNADQTGKYKMCYDYEVRYKCCDYSHCGKETSTPGATTAATTALPGTTPEEETPPGTSKGSTPAPPVPSTTSRTTVVSPTPEVPASPSTAAVTSVKGSTVTAVSLQSTPVSKPTALLPTTESTPEVPVSTTKSILTPPASSTSGITSTTCQPNCQWTQWFDTYYPSSSSRDGDFETLEDILSEGHKVCENPTDIQCRAADYPEVSLALLGQKLKCNLRDGLQCLNADQTGKYKMCYDYEVRYKCCDYSHCGKETSTPGATTAATTALPGSTPKVETPPGTSKGSTPAPPVPSTTSRTTVVSPTPEVPASPSTAAVTSVKSSTVTPVSLQSTPVSKPTALLPTTESTPEVPVSTTKSILTPPASSTSGITSTTCQPNCQWTQWFDTYYPSSSSRDGDFESLEDILSEGHKVCENPTDIQCRAADYPEVSFALLGQKLTCNLRDGLQCLNADQTGKYKMCYDYEVRYKCCDYSHCGKETSTPGATTAATTALPGTTPKVETPPGTSKGSTPAPPVPSTTSRTTVVSPTPEVPASPSTAAVTSVKSSTVTPVSLQSTPVSKPTALLPTTESTPEVPVSTTKSILTPPASSTSGITSTTCQPNCQWTQWFDTYYPSSSSRDGDFESLEDILSDGHKVCENPTDIQCRAADYPEVSLALLGQKLMCNLRDGLQCLNADQTGKYKMCYDYEVRYKCCDYSHCGKETSTPGATTAATTALPGTTPEEETPPGTSKGSTPAPPVPSTTSRTTVVSTTPEVPASPSTPAVTSVKGSTVTAVSLQSTPVSKPTALLPTTESTPEVPVSTTKSILTPPASSTSGITSTTCQPNCQWTQWFDTYYPSSSSRDGDFETLEDILSEGHKVCENPTDIQCRAADYPEVSLSLLGQKLTCNLRDGLQCLNADQTGKYKMCYDYEVRYKCCDYSHCGQETSTPGATTAATTALPGTTPKVETPPGTSKGSTPAPPVPSTTSRTTVVSPTPEVPASPSTAAVTSIKSSTVTPVSLQSTPVSKPTALLPTTESTPEVPVSTTKSILTPPASSTSGITSTTCQPNCQWTQWFDTYYPSSSSRDGDFESLEDILSDGHKVCENPTDIQCRAADYPEVSLALLGQKLTCNLRDGLQCLNADQTGKYKMCYDYEVRYKCCDYSHCGKETSTPGATTAATTVLPGTTPEEETPPGTSKGSTPAPPVPSTTSRTTVVSTTPEVPASPSTPAVTSVKGSTVTAVSLQSTPVSKPTALLPTTESTPEVPVSTTKSILTPPASSTSGITSTTCQPNCQWTQWFDTYYPSSSSRDGDFESLEDILSEGHKVCENPTDIQCRAADYPEVSLSLLGQKLTCNLRDGLQCLNADQTGKYKMCYDYEVRYKCCDYSHCGLETSTPGATTAATTALPGTTPKVETPPGTSKGSTPAPPVPSTTSRTTVVSPTPEVPASPSTAAVTSVKSSTVTPVSLQSTPVSKPTALLPTTESTPEVPVSTTKSILTPPASSTSGITSTTCQPNCQWTQWFDTYYPSSSSRDGDFESLEDILSDGHKVCENPTDIQCRAADYPEVSLALLGQKLTCNLRDGLQCLNADQTGKYKMCYDYEVRYKCCDYSHCGKETSTPGATTAATTALPGTTPEEETPPGTSKGSTPAPPVPSTTSRTTVVSPTPEVPASPSTPAVTSVKGSTVTAVSLQSTPVSKPTALLPTTESTPEVPVSTTKSILTPPASSTSGITSTTCQPNCQWTQWFDTYYPSSSSRDGDFESLEDILSEGHKVCENPTDIQCRAADYPEVSLALLGQKLTCNLRDGLQCLNADQTGKYKMCYDYEVRYKCCDYSHCGQETSTPGATTAATTALPGTTPKVETPPGTSKGSTPAPPVPSTTSRTTVVSPTPEVPASPSTAAVTSVKSSTVTPVSLQSTPVSKPTALLPTTESTEVPVSTTKSILTPPASSTSGITSTTCQPNCQWTQWFDTYYPSSSSRDGDFESLEDILSEGHKVCENPTDIQCRAADYPEVSLALLGQKLTCNLRDGLQCLNADQTGKYKMCYDYEVRYKCCDYSHCGQETSTPGATTAATTALPGTTPEEETPPGTSKGSTPAPPVPSTTSRTTVVSPTPEVPASPSTAAVTSVKGSTVTPVSLQSTSVSKPTALLPTTESTPEVPVSTTKSILTPPASSTSGITSTTCQPNCQWTQWFDTYYPSSSSRDGDFESLEDILSEGHKVCENPTDIQCRAADYPEVSLALLGQKLTCNLRDGLQCLNADQTGKYKMCYDYEVRYKCCDYSHCGQETSTPGATTAATTALPGTTPEEETSPGTPKGSTPAPPVPSTTSRTTVVSTTPEVSASPSTTSVTSVKGSTVTAVSLQSTPVSKPTALLPTTESTPEVPVSTTKSTLSSPISTAPGITSTTCLPICQWTEWFDTHHPTSRLNDGDFETLEHIRMEGIEVCKNPRNIECRAEEYPDVNIFLLGQKVECNLRDGLRCFNADQTGASKTCLNYQIRFQCCDSSHCFPGTSSPVSTTGATTVFMGATSGVATSPAISQTSTEPPPIPTITFTRTTAVSTSSEVPSSSKTPTVKVSTAIATSLHSTPISKPAETKPSTVSSTSRSSTEGITTVTLQKTTPCFCHVSGTTNSLYFPGEVIYNRTDSAGCSFYAICSKTCEIERFQGPCPSTTPSHPSTLSVTTTATPPASKSTVFVPATELHTTTSVPTAPSTTGCPDIDPPRMTNETWMLNNCTTAICEGNNRVVLILHPPPEKIQCASGLQPVKIEDKDGCAHYECECICSGWASTNYLTFDGSFYNFHDNCTYVLVKEIVDKHGNFSVLVDNYFCDAENNQDCSRAIIIHYNSMEVVLYSQMSDARRINKVTFNHDPVHGDFNKDGIIVTSSGSMMSVEIPAINAFISFNGVIYTVKLPYSQFQHNTEGQCGTCTNDQSDDCRLPSGHEATSCSEMAAQWLVYDKNRTHCQAVPTPQPPVSPTPEQPVSPTPTICSTPAPLCELIVSDIFVDCHKVLPPKVFYEDCLLEACHSSNDSLNCHNVELYASLCAAKGLCSDWRSKTQGRCPYSCPKDKVYKPCGPVHPPTCEDGSTVTHEVAEGCFCSDDKILFSSYTDICVQECGCVGPDGLPKLPGSSWKSNCQECVCDPLTVNVQCKPQTCNTSKTPVCEKDGFIPVSVLTPEDPCCPQVQCQCNVSACTNKKKSCEPGYHLAMIHFEGDCCSSFECEPTPDICVINQTVYTPGMTVPSKSCEKCICSNVTDSDSKRNIVQCTPVTCDATCPAGYEYEESDGECCGKCVQVACIINVNGTAEVVKPGDIWQRKDNNCSQYECEKLDDTLILVNVRRTCPPLDPECKPDEIEITPDGCCKTCKPVKKDCKVHKNQTLVRQNECVSSEVVEMTYCEGTCPSSSVYSNEAKAMQHKCTCCQELKSHRREVTLTCSDGRSINYDYIYVEECQCMTACIPETTAS